MFLPCELSSQARRERRCSRQRSRQAGRLERSAKPSRLSALRQSGPAPLTLCRTGTLRALSPGTPLGQRAKIESASARVGELGFELARGLAVAAGARQLEA